MPVSYQVSAGFISAQQAEKCIEIRGVFGYIVRVSRALSAHWNQLKKDIWDRAKGRCERCTFPLTSGSAHLHHLTYARKGKELPGDVIYLCLHCHGLEHPKHNFVPVAIQRLTAAKRKKQRERRSRRALPTPGPAEKDAAYDHVMLLMANRKEQRQRSGKHKRPVKGMTRTASR